MADVNPALNTPTDLSNTSSVADALNASLADCYALYLKTKNFHWHVSGPHFRDYHLMFDEQATEILGVTDLIAERVRKTGNTTLRSMLRHTAEGRPFFSLSGGAVCAAHRPPGSVAPRVESVVLMEALLAGDWSIADAAASEVQREVNGIVAAYTQWHLERELRSLPHVDRRDKMAP